MKRFDDSTKKLIKNVAALITSALVLIAATVAWFASGSRANVNTINAKIENRNFSITYFKMKSANVTGVLKSATVSGGTPTFTFDTAKTIASKMDNNDDPQNTVWDSTQDFSISSLEPGSYWSYRIHVQASGYLMPTLVARGATWTGTVADADKETVYKNVYVYAVVVQTSVDENTGNPVYTTKGSACCSLYDMLHSGGQFAKALTATQTTGSFDVLLDIGVPGESVISSSGTDKLYSAHDALRQIGATFTLTGITVDG